MFAASASSSITRFKHPATSPPTHTHRWVYADAAVYSASQKAPFALHYLLPGLVATLGVLLLGAAGSGGDDDAAYSYYDDGDGAACRGKCVLFLAYVIAFGSIFSAVTLLLVDRQRGLDLWAPAAATIQCTVLSASGLLLWLSRGGGGDDDGYGLLS